MSSYVLIPFKTVFEVVKKSISRLRKVETDDRVVPRKRRIRRTAKRSPSKKEVKNES